MLSDFPERLPKMKVRPRKVRVQFDGRSTQSYRFVVCADASQPKSLPPSLLASIGAIPYAVPSRLPTPPIVDELLAA